MKNTSDRDRDACMRYLQGTTLPELSKELGVGVQRMRQILKRGGVYQPRRDAKRTGRDEFIGINVTEEAKLAIQLKAKEQGISVSQFVSTTLAEVIK